MKLTNKILTRSCKQAQFDRPSRNRWLCEQMLEFMQGQDAVGLAANQIGLDLRLFVMSVDGISRCCFNPEIMLASPKSVTMAEGCLSFIGKQCIIQRPEQIQVRYQNHDGSWVENCLSALESRVFQHELDHLNGITMWHRKNEQTITQ